ncbi:MAG: methyltransferase [Amaricoccus sp.]|uniref:tRNA1(Val) (adenine(37)-N6)-methyltransferase n=1 Tax=Amaricoccus sp. TaxID=1872485 RepID=UPI0039E60984
MSPGETGELTRDGFLGGRLAIWQPRDGYRAAIDPVLLAAFVPAAPGERVLDLGCGAGTAALCLGRRVPGLDLHGLELQPAYAALARTNAAENGIALTVHEGDLARPPAELRAASFDHVMMNPPYHPADSVPARDVGRDTAHREGESTLDRWLDAGLRRLRPGGRLAIVHAPARLGEILGALAGRAGSVDLLPVAPRAGQPARRVLVSARKNRGADLRVWPPFTLHEEGSHTPPVNRYTRDASIVLREAGGLWRDGRVGVAT